MEINENKLNKLGLLMSARGFKLSLAESMSAGFFTSIWSLQTESGDYLQGSIVSYAEEVKTDILKVSPLLIEQFSAESIQITEAMLEGLKRLIPADIHIAVTGKAFADKEKNANAISGDVFLTISFKEKVISQKLHFPAENAAEVFIMAFNSSLEILESLLSESTESHSIMKD